jgi:hypothetical protein
MTSWRLARVPSYGLAAALSLMVCLPAVPEAQEKTPASLAELARKELERRKAVKRPSKVFTDKEVRGTLPKPVAPAADPSVPVSPDPSAAAQKVAPQKAEETKDEAWWRARVTAVREEMRRNQMFADALQSRINQLAADFANRDDPFQRLKIADDRQKALMELERVQSDSDKLKTQLADIEEEARKAGVPPGWLR